MEGEGELEEARERGRGQDGDSDGPGPKPLGAEATSRVTRGKRPTAVADTGMLWMCVMGGMGQISTRAKS